MVKIHWLFDIVSAAVVRKLIDMRDGVKNHHVGTQSHRKYKGLEQMLPLS